MAAFGGRGLPPPGGGGKRGRDTKVSLPLLTPQPFLGTRLPSVARLKARGHRGVWCSKARSLIEAELFAAERCRSAQSGRALLCAAPYAREIQGITASRNLPDARNRAPVPPFSRATAGSRGSKEGQGSQEGTGNHVWCPVPFCPPPWARRLRRRRRQCSRPPRA